MTIDELIDKYLKEKAECNQKSQEARRLKRETTDQEQKAIHEANQDYYATRKHAIEDFIKDLEQLDIQKSLYSKSSY
ncbi:hypothetical protein D3C75_282110 [compost metagenome]